MLQYLFGFYWKKLDPKALRVLLPTNAETVCTADDFIGYWRNPNEERISSTRS